MNLSAQQIEQLATEIRKFLLDNQLWQDVNIYFNGKAFSTCDGSGHYYYNDPNHLIELEGQNPRQYFEYVADPHILSMSFEGDFCDCLNYYNENGAEFDDRITSEFSNILHRCGLYYELGNHWNLTCFPQQQDDAPALTVNRQEEPIRFFGERVMPEGAVVPEQFIRIQEEWKKRANEYGDIGSCVLGAGFRFKFEGRQYKMPPTSRWQGSVSWEHCVDDIKKMLETAGAEDICFDWGVMD